MTLKYYDISSLDELSRHSGYDPDVYRWIFAITQLSPTSTSPILHRLANNASIPPDLAIILAEFSDVNLSKTLATTTTDTDVLTLLSRHSSFAVRLKVAENPNCPGDVLGKLSKSSVLNLRLQVLHNPNIPVEVFVKAARSSDVIERQTVALEQNCPIDILKQLADDVSDEVQYAVARHPNCPEEVLVKLSESHNDNVLRDVVGNSNCPEEVLRRLADDRNAYVRQGIAENPHCPEDVRNYIIQHSNDDFRLWVIASLPDITADALRLLYTHIDRNIYIAIASNPNCPVDILTQLARDSSSSVREAVAGNPLLPQSLIIQLMSDPDRSVCTAAGNNPNWSHDSLLAYSKGNNVKGHCMLSQRNDLPGDVLRALAAQPMGHPDKDIAIHPNCPGDVLNQLATSEYYYIREGVAENPNCPPNILSQLAGDEVQAVRRAVARHPNCPGDVLMQLVKDDDFIVRGGVARNPNCPVDGLALLLVDDDSDTWDAALHNSSVTSSLLSHLADALPDLARLRLIGLDKCPHNVFKYIIMSDDLKCRLPGLLLCNDDELITSFIVSHSTDEDSLRFLACKPDISVEAVHALISTGFSSVIDILNARTDLNERIPEMGLYF